jgi:hypothetical protein
MSTLGKSRMGDKMGSGLEAKSKSEGSLSPGVNWKMDCVREGETIWTEEWHNLVTDSGLIYMLNVGLANSASIIAAWYVGLIVTGGATVVAADTMSSHAGWTEFSAYSASTLPVWVGGTADAQGATGNHETTNSASVAAFGINANTSVAGAFLTHYDSKNSGVSGIIYAGGNFTGGDRTGLQNSDTLNVTATFSAITG